MQECIRIMFNLLEKPVITRKICNKVLVIFQLSAIIEKKVQRYQYLNTDIYYISNKDMKKQLNVSNKVLATKEASEYFQRTHLNSPALFQHQYQARFHIYDEV